MKWNPRLTSATASCKWKTFSRQKLICQITFSHSKTSTYLYLFFLECDLDLDLELDWDLDFDLDECDLELDRPIFASRSTPSQKEKQWEKGKKMEATI